MASNYKDMKFKLLIFNVDDNKKTQEEINKYGIDKSNIHAVVTASNNLMIYLDDINDLNKIMSDDVIFKEKKKLNMNENEKDKLDIVIRGLTLYKAREYGDYLESIGISQLISLESRKLSETTERNKIKIVAARLKNKVMIDNLVRDGINLDYIHYKVEKFKKPIHVMQCLKCNQFNHKASDCKNDECCKNCGGKHLSKVCTSNEKLCVNCGGDHKATYKQCKEYVKFVDEKTERINGKKEKSKQQMNRVESSMGKNQIDNDKGMSQILEAINGIKEGQKQLEKKMDDKIEVLIQKENRNAENIKLLETNLTAKIDMVSLDANSKMGILEENIKTIDKNCVNIFVDCHNAVNPNQQITVDHIKKVLNGQRTRHNETNPNKTTKSIPQKSTPVNNNTNIHH
jgi:hypothetical protein